MRIGELADTAGLSAKTVRFYESAGLLPPPARTSGGYRDYGPASVARLAFIKDAQGAGLRLAEIRDVLAIRDAGQPPCQHVTELIGAHLRRIETRIADLNSARAALRTLARRAADTDPAACTEQDMCRIITGP